MHTHTNSDTQALKKTKTKQTYYLRVRVHFKCQPDDHLLFKWTVLGQNYLQYGPEFMKFVSQKNQVVKFLFRSKEVQKGETFETYSPFTSSRAFITEDNPLCAPG